MAIPSNWILHRAFLSRLASKKIDLSTDTLKIGLAESISNIDQVAINNYSDITNELATGNGYTAGGRTINGVSMTTLEQGGVVVTGDNTSWTATDGPISAAYAFIYCDSDANKTVIAHSLLDTDLNNVVAENGQVFVVKFGTNGFLSIQ